MNAVLVLAVTGNAVTFGFCFTDLFSPRLLQIRPVPRD